MPIYTPDSDLSWHGIAYPAGVPVVIPDDLAAALGLAVDGDPLPMPVEDDQPPALRLINGTDVVRDLSVIPTIGAGAAKRLIQNRPFGGYANLSEVWALNPELLIPPYRINLDVVASWGGQ
jgi:hypothetical protein